MTELRDALHLLGSLAVDASILLALVLTVALLVVTLDR